jgi:hypothetical protein
VDADGGDGSRIGRGVIGGAPDRATVVIIVGGAWVEYDGEAVREGFGRLGDEFGPEAVDVRGVEGQAEGPAAEAPGAEEEVEVTQAVGQGRARTLGTVAGFSGAGGEGSGGGRGVEGGDAVFDVDVARQGGILPGPSDECSAGGGRRGG